VYYFLYNRVRVFLVRPKQSLIDELKESDEVWFAWHSGSVNLAQGALFEGNHKYKIVLTDPNSAAINEIGRVANINATELKSNITEFTRILRQKEAPGNELIKWFDGILGSSLVISNPGTNKAWVRVEAFLPFLGAQFRPSIKIYRNRNFNEYKKYEDLFNDIWNNRSSAPT
jgi:hypothetical protein